MQPKQSLGRRVLCLPGKVLSWLIVPLVLSIILAVVAAHMGWSTLIDWNGRVPILGSALTVNSLVDFQWYAFALIVLFGGVWTFFEDRHVTVDFLAANMRPRTRAWVALFGDLFLLLPLCVLVVWYGARFAAVAWSTGEGSNQGGLTAHWLIKGALPASFFLLGAGAVLHAIETALGLFRPAKGRAEGDDAR
ncbi:MAG: TRAP transporter small permease subunit [Rhodobacter sp.]|uniref:TRAP transporter small permease subunit n=1 Tax=Pararhodobacter sp. TaxID=2127056 RepID=UPI001D70D9C9|nr:TRAP transporter small permease subunit [Pararhodobacter sp.]MCB1344775.1 TRAP transporter small permease subunit [Paracoccaceae bacterium]MCC0072665.1 TRAP transporter small permease subunit [Rhodobacter sp.]HPD93209.1 TRAP transporter small permease subunit [Pararhodobacter sp.]